MLAKGVDMFDSVLRPDFSQNRLGTGVVIAVAAHALIAMVAVTLSRPSRKIVIPAPVWPPVRIFDPVPPGQAARTETQSAEPRRIRPRDAFHVPRNVPVPLPQRPTLEDSDMGDSNGEFTASPGSPDGVPGAPLTGPQPTTVLLRAPPRIELDEGVVRLKKISGPDPEYTQQALDREVEGTIIAKCVVTSHGMVERCRILSSLPFMDRPVIDALERRRYEPYRMNGTPVEVDYTFRIKLQLPR